MLFENAGKEVKTFSAGLYVTLRSLIVILGVVSCVYYAFAGAYNAYQAGSIVAAIVAVLYTIVATIIITWVASLLAYLFCLICAAFGELVEGVNETGKNTKAIAESLKK